MTLNEGLEIIRREMLAQANKHHKSAVKKINAYRINNNISSLIEGVRLDVKADALRDISKALTVKKVREWRDKKENRGG